eukprot:jgi/Ulvmu1/12643/UM093_0036.1
MMPPALPGSGACRTRPQLWLALAGAAALAPNTARRCLRAAAAAPHCLRHRPALLTLTAVPPPSSHWKRHCLRHPLRCCGSVVAAGASHWRKNDP